MNGNQVQLELCLFCNHPITHHYGKNESDSELRCHLSKDFDGTKQSVGQCECLIQEKQCVECGTIYYAHPKNGIAFCLYCSMGDETP